MAMTANIPSEIKSGQTRRRNTLIAYSFLAPNLIGFFVITLHSGSFVHPAGVSQLERRNAGQDFIGRGWTTSA